MPQAKTLSEKELKIVLATVAQGMPFHTTHLAL